MDPTEGSSDGGTMVVCKTFWCGKEYDLESNKLDPCFIIWGDHKQISITKHFNVDYPNCCIFRAPPGTLDQSVNVMLFNGTHTSNTAHFKYTNKSKHIL